MGSQGRPSSDALIRRFVKNRRFSELLWRFPRACERSANSEYFERLNNLNFGWRAAASGAPWMTRDSFSAVHLAARRPN